MDNNQGNNPQGISNNDLEEIRLLGSSLVNPSGYIWEKTIASLKSEDFLSPVSRTLYQEMKRAEEKSNLNDPVYIGQALTAKGYEDGAAIVANAIAEAAPVATAEIYIEQVRSRSLQRSLQQKTQAMMNDLANASGNPEAINAIYGEFVQSIEEISAVSESLEWVTAQAAVNDATKKPAPADLPTGFIDLDEKFNGGLRNGQMIVIAGRPAMGKTTLCLDIARHNLTRPGLLVSLEMSRQELGRKLLSAQAGIDFGRITRGDLTDSDIDLADKANNRFYESKMMILDDSSLSDWGKCKSAIRSAKRRYGIEYAAIDHLQLMNYGSDTTQRHQQVSDISREVKLLAKELRIPIILVCQLNRNVEGRTDKKPMMSDLRDSGSVEQDADIVLLPYREDYYQLETERAGEADLIISKHRGGPTGTVTVAFQGHYSRFNNMYRY